MTDDEQFLDRAVARIWKAMFLFAAAGVAGAFWMAWLVDRGLTAPWAVWQQGAWFVAMIGLLSLGGKRILRGLGGDERFAWLPLLALGFLAVVLFVGWQLRVTIGVPFWSTFLASFAGIVGWGTWRRPWWFWEDWRAKWLRGLIGDRWARLVYAGAAILLAIGAVQVGLR